MSANSTSSDAILNSIITTGDLSKLTPDQKVDYYRTFCEKLGLDPVSQPFKLLRLNGREILYCDRSGSQQLCKRHSVSHEIKARENVFGCYVVTAQASTPDGRHTESIGAVPVENLKGDNLCNAMMKAETKAKRRATLDLLGLGILDESEAAAIASDEAKLSVPVAGEPKEQKVAAPASQPPAATAKQQAKPKEATVAAKQTVKSPEEQCLELLKTLRDTGDLTALEKLYYANQGEVETDTELKKAFESRKAELEKNIPKVTQPAAVSGNDTTRFSSVCKTSADLKTLINEAANVDQLTSLFNANQKLIETENLKSAFTDRRMSFAKAAMATAPVEPGNDELAKRSIDWFKERMGKEVWMDKPGGYSGRLPIESDDYPRWLAEDQQAEGARFREVTEQDPPAPPEA